MRMRELVWSSLCLAAAVPLAAQGIEGPRAGKRELLDSRGISETQDQPSSWGSRARERGVSPSTDGARSAARKGAAQGP